jgi:hypothetical protein
MRRSALALAIIVAVGAALRIPGLFTDFWLDEIWTLAIVQSLGSPLEIFSEIRHSNNHYLNTLVFYFLGDSPHWIPFRIHSLLAGIGAVALAWLIAARGGLLPAMLASGATAVSYLLIHYSSEARGYAMAVLFAFAAFLAARSFVERSRWRDAVVLWVAVCLGLLSQLSYIHVLAALVLWLPTALYRMRRSVGETVARAAQALAVPVAFMVVFYWVELRHMQIGGAPGQDRLGVLIKTLSYAGGGPGAGPFAAIVALATLGILMGAVVWRARQGSDDWLFYAVAIFASPGALLLFQRSEALFVRYFVVSVAFGLVIAGMALSNLVRGPVAARAAVVSIVGLFVLGNLVNVAGFYRYGRGAYLEGLQMIARESPGIATVASDHDFRNGALFAYYRDLLGPGRRPVYVPAQQLPRGGTGWFIEHRIGELGEVGDRHTDRYGNVYDLRAVLPYSDLSGMHWLIYRRE